MRAQKLSEEHKRHISESLLGVPKKPFTPEHKATVCCPHCQKEFLIK